MTTEQDTPKSSEELMRDYLELLIHKLDVMKFHGSAYYARKQDADKRYFDAAKKDVNEYIVLLKKRGFSGARFNIKPSTQPKLL